MLAVFISLSAATLLFVGVSAQNSEPILVLRSNQTVYFAGPYLTYLEDPGQELRFDQIIQPSYADQFRAGGGGDILNFGMSTSAYWLRLRIRNDAPADIQWQIELARPSLKAVAIYRPDGDAGNYTARETGYIYPFTTREIPYENFIFNLNIPPGGEQIIYMRVQDQVMELPLRVWQESALQAKNANESILYALLYGAMLIMLAHTILITIVLKEPSYGYHVFFQLSLMLCIASVLGHTSHYLWPRQVDVTWYVISLSIGLTMLSTLLFAGAFFNIRKQPRGWQLGHDILGLMLGIATISAPIINVASLNFIFPLGLLALIYSFALALYAWTQKDKSARFYLLSWGVYLLITIDLILKQFGLVIVDLPEQALQIGLVLGIALQSIALADRFNLFREEKLQAEKALAQTLTRSQAELEQKVSERTQELAREIEIRKQAQAAAEYLSQIDSLTGLFNRRHFSAMVEREFSRAARYQESLSILIMDIDLFKNVNDTFGHPVGDLALKHAARIMQTQCRDVDIVARYGGEEFVALLPKTNGDAARIIAERLRLSIENTAVVIKDNIVTMTVSIGVASLNPPFQSNQFDELLKNADRALYDAKNSGRNRVVVYEQGGGD